MPAHRIRRADASDAPAIAANVVALARHTEARELDPARALAGVVAALRRNETPGWVAEVADAERTVVIGQALTSAEWSDWNNGWYWWMQSVWVASAHRRAGVLRALMDAATTEARARGVLAVRLCVDGANHGAIAAYGALGFGPSGYSVMEFPLG